MARIHEYAAVGSPPSQPWDLLAWNVMKKEEKDKEKEEKDEEEKDEEEDMEKENIEGYGKGRARWGEGA